ncbi:MAG: hypothetical protein NWR51_12280 [Akkermansiaceae bacterium]|jgi:hypothetical protein|nr:hypothetical protein [Akkermansiaceae bacterium]MDP4781563.1 hypothetical protein [Akkermansiaceae bacterium]MDP4848024.1 hypothetical protein [Akkermansiaceae bacterium]MDP4898877.1 hypothetical protein [Akkermansiaceae bacterium]MDP4994601.1 hypothetical protein [Akkermansiaceae bacterium]
MNLRYILTRAAAAILIIVVALYSIDYLKKKQRLGAIVSELKSLSSDSSFFRQFSAADAEKSLIRAIGLIAEANKLGLDPEAAIDQGLGIKKKYFNSDDDKEPTYREQLIRSTLRSNYENFRKLGYTPDFYTLESFEIGELPPVRNGPLQGSMAEVGTIIDSALSPGLDTVLANLEIRPIREKGKPLTDVEIAIAKKLAVDLEEAGVIEEIAFLRIQSNLSGEKKAEEVEAMEE